VEGLPKSTMSPFQSVKQCGGLKKVSKASEFIYAIVCSSIYFFPLFSGFDDSEISHSDENPFFLITSGEDH
jgi:hypothetical protein